jgi:murein DD-endopeptidase MepM/ murein hydrolase activator NlpD
MSLPASPSRLGCGLAALLLIGLVAPAGASGAVSPIALRLAPERVKQGGIVMAEIAAPAPLGRVGLSLGGRAIPVAGSGPAGAAWRIPIGVDLEETPGALPIRVEAADAAGRLLTGQATLVVVDGKYPVQRLTLPRSFSELDAPTLERVAREKAGLDALWEQVTPERFGRGRFRPPLDGAGSGVAFGLRRIINGDPRAPHSGVDYGAPAGTPVLASQAALVAVAEEHFFGGRSVVLDHGWGLYTMYFHLEEIAVRPGQRVDQGAVIGRVGATGRATGPHLHWGVRLLGARVDPGELLKLSLDGW